MLQRKKEQERDRSLLIERERNKDFEIALKKSKLQKEVEDEEIIFVSTIFFALCSYGHLV